MTGQLQTDMTERFGAAVKAASEKARVDDRLALQSAEMDRLAWEAVFGGIAEREAARRALWELGQATGVRPASIHELYLACGRGECGGFTVPAINVRMLGYDTARAVFRAARQREVGALILEIARSEIAYTDQRPAEYVAVILAAALREGYELPLFIQGDHCQVNAKKYAADPDGEIEEVKKLIAEEIGAGFFNIDVDTSTLVDLGQPTLALQQRANYERAAEITRFIRSIEPQQVTVSVGGEIGEVGMKNSTVEELHAFMEGYNRSLAGGDKSLAGLSKISVQTGTSHGGVVLPDGSIAEVKLDLAALEALSRAARERYGLGGAVQHGASTLPSDAFGNFPRVGAIEIHLATNFQNIIFDHPDLPGELRERMRECLDQNAAGERKTNDTDEQFYYRARKKAIGPFKRDCWMLPEGLKAKITADLERTFGFLFDQLNVKGTAFLIPRFVPAPALSWEGLHQAGARAADDAEAGE
jgi:fructose-bisphosphate aldolase class II